MYDCMLSLRKMTKPRTTNKITEAGGEESIQEEKGVNLTGDIKAEKKLVQVSGKCWLYQVIDNL